MATYPVVKIPYALGSLLSGNLPVPPVVPAPKSPQQPNEPLKPNLEKVPENFLLDFVGKGLLTIGVFCILICIIALFSGEGMEFGAILTTLAFLGVGGVMVNIVESNKNTIIEKNNQVEKKYEVALNDYKYVRLPSYQKEFLDFQQKQQEHINSKKQHEEELLRQTNQVYFKAKQQQLIENILLQSTKPLRNTRQTRRGVSEDSFSIYLNKYFGERIITGVSLAFNDESINPYVPDFVLFNKELNLYVDIEIDEPYIGATGEPIHYIESNDSYRDVFFNGNNWIVIRFSEQQIANLPEYCCNEIGKAVNKIKPTYSWVNETLSLSPEKMWTKDQAISMALRRSRNTYLTSALAEEVKYELTINRIKIEEQKKINLTTAFYDDSNDLPF